MSDDSPKVWASLGATINTGNYENQKIDIGVTNIPVNCTPEQLQMHLDMAKSTLQEVVEALANEMGRTIKENYGR